MNFPSALLVLAALASCSLVAEEARWTTSRIHGSPEPGKAYLAEQVFPSLPLNNVVDMVPVPGLAQWLFVENGGRILVVPNDETTAQADVAIDLKALHKEVDHAYGAAFHPKFKDNKQVFITYTNGDKKDDGSRLSRFKVKQDKPLQIDPTSEEILLTWRSGGHNGAAVTFGNDGMLYVSVGDSEVPAPPDPLVTGQDLTDFLSTVVRIDVDHKDAGKNYAVPKDNPFVGTPNARPEIWCFGLRNPWKLSFDKPTATLWCGDVGWEQWEQIHVIKRGANYGWSAMEGNNPILPERKHPVVPITPPIVTHSHSEAASITGGFVYRGKRLPELTGAYLYADYETGKIWALNYDGAKIVEHEEIADTPLKIVSFGQSEDGEIYFIHYSPQGSVHRLRKNPDAGKQSDFPRKLSETGLFVDVAKQTPSTGVKPFSVRAPMWADGAEATRCVALPSGSVETKVWTDKRTNQLRSKMTWPAETVLAKTITMLKDESKPASMVKVETQVLHFDGYAWNAYSYRWNETGTDASLVVNDGDEREMELVGNRFPGGSERYRYRFHSRTECLRCHNSWSGFALGMQPQQLTDPAALQAAGFFDDNFMKQSEARLVDPEAAHESLDARARSWLHANCAHCHRENGGGAVAMVLNVETPLEGTHTIASKAMRGDFGIADSEVLSSAVPWNSVLLHRISTLGANRMPMIGAQSVDVKGALLLQTWLMSLQRAAPSVRPPLSLVRSAVSESGWLSTESEWIASRERNPRLLDELMADVPGAAFVAYAMDATMLPADDHARAIKLGTTASSPHIRGLFERFLPSNQRVETLGASASSAKIAALSGDVDRGSALFSASGKAAACLACHLIHGTGRDFGPDLSHVGARLPSPQILESLLTPSKIIAPGFATMILAVKDGSTQVGFVVKRGGGTVSVKIATGQVIALKTKDVMSEIASPVSLMPEGQLQALTAQEAADLVAYLSALK